MRLANSVLLFDLCNVPVVQSVNRMRCQTAENDVFYGSIDACIAELAYFIYTAHLACSLLSLIVKIKKISIKTMALILVGRWMHLA